MAKSTLPPQAYTRDTLAQAYEWLKSQPGSTRELANNADDLVGLYLHYMRRKRAEKYNYEDLASSQNFKKDLKNLADGFRQFDEEKTSKINDSSSNINLNVNVSQPHQTNIPLTFNEGTQDTTRSVSHFHPSNQAPQPQQPQTINYQPAPQPTHPNVNPNTVRSTVQTAPSPQQTYMQPTAPAPQNVASSEVMMTNTMMPSAINTQLLDFKTREMILKVQNGFNLKSEEDALRLLIATGYSKIKDSIPPSDI